MDLHLTRLGYKRDALCNNLQTLSVTCVTGGGWLDWHEDEVLRTPTSTGLESRTGEQEWKQDERSEILRHIILLLHLAAASGSL
jgi:hypothetical protein